MIAVVALAILVSRGQFQMLPIALIGLVLGPAIIVAFFKGPERRFLLTLFFTAFAARLLVAVVWPPDAHHADVQQSRASFTATWVGMMFEDDRAYHKVGYGLMEYWLGDEGGVEKSDELPASSVYVHRRRALHLRLLHHAANLLAMTKPEAGAITLMAPKLMNCFIGAIGIVPFYALGRELGGERAGRIVALAAAFWPSLLLWSVLNLKDVMVVVLIATTMFLAIRFARSPGISLWLQRQAAGELLLTAQVGLGVFVLVGLLVSFALMENLRLYVFYAFGWLVPIAFFFINRAPWKRRLAAGLALWAVVADRSWLA